MRFKHFEEIVAIIETIDAKAEKNPKWLSGVKCFYRTILDYQGWNNAGKTYYNHPDKGWGYYYDNIVERLKNGGQS